jgi:hypothetical protein
MSMSLGFPGTGIRARRKDREKRQAEARVRKESHGFPDEE